MLRVYFTSEDLARMVFAAEVDPLWEVLFSRFRLQERARHPTGGYVGEEILPGVAEVSVLDRPTTMEFVDRRRCDRWQVSVAEVLAAGRRNLIDAPEPGRWKKLRNVPLWELDNADEYSAARLLQPGWLLRHRPPGCGQIVIGIPARQSSAPEPSSSPQRARSGMRPSGTHSSRPASS
jgi:hypothetical protein